MKVRIASPVDGHARVVASNILFFAIILASPIDAACFLGAFGDSLSCNGRYFTQTGILPPLTTVTTAKRQQLHGFNNCTELGGVATAVAMPSFVSSGVPVTYTNNPKVVDNWLVENLPYDGSIIGFDVEVSFGSLVVVRLFGSKMGCLG